MPSIDTQTQFCAVIGNPVGHSLSPAIHNAAFAAANLNFVYGAFRVEDVAACLRGMRAMEGFRGLSVTIPHKVAAMAEMDELDPMAQRVGCINTVTNTKGVLRGSVTDGTGTLRAFREAGVSLEGRRVLFLGAGGAVRAVAFAFAMQPGIGQVSILAREPRKASALAHEVSTAAACPVGSGHLREQIEGALASHDIIIQGTPVGMHPHEGAMCVPAGHLRPDQIVFDMVYRPLKTAFIREAEATGCTTVLGSEMLVQQAAEQFETWTGAPAPVAVMREALLSALAPPDA
ncbi:MAG: shikimate dehydrogenase [Candidatus Hydrogenedentes bacterium]|nr:shikimate dehydrogenase [Candidatus Hydrogenedentota bacterium]